MAIKCPSVACCQKKGADRASCVAHENYGNCPQSRDRPESTGFEVVAAVLYPAHPWQKNVAASASRGCCWCN